MEAARTVAPLFTDVSKTASRQVDCAPQREANPRWQAMAMGVQPKLAVSSPSDPDEHEADRVADAVMQDADVPRIQQLPRRVARKCAACASGGPLCPKCEEEERLQRKHSGTGAAEVDDDFNVHLAGGFALSANDRQFYESRMGHDFGDVRIHADAAASESTRAVGARAYTLGNHIAFAAGEFDTSSASGRHLLGHELTHVVQQRGGGQSIQRSPGAHQAEIERSRTSPGRFVAVSSPPPPHLSLYNFAIDDATLKGVHQELLEELADVANEGQIWNISIVGHADSTGDDLINGPLSNDRAMTVEEFLYQSGVTVAGVDSQGSNSPVASNASEAGRSRNRRVDIFFEMAIDPPPPGHHEPSGTEEPPNGGGGGGGGWDWPDLPSLPCLDSFGHALLCGTGIFCMLNSEICLSPLIPSLPWPDLPDWPWDDDPDEPDDPDELQCGDPQLPLTHVDFIPPGGDRGNRVEARPLTRCEGNTHGSQPDIPALFPTLWQCIVDQDGPYRWVHAHLLHGETSSSGPRNLHGPGDDVRNIIFADRSINGRMSSRVEQAAIHRVWDNNEVLWYDVQVNHFTGPYPRPFFAESVDMAFGTHDPLTGLDSPALVTEHITSGTGFQPPHCDDPNGPTDQDDTPGPTDTPSDEPPIIAGPTIGPADGPMPAPSPDAACGNLSCAAFDYYRDSIGHFRGGVYIVTADEQIIREMVRLESAFLRRTEFASEYTLLHLEALGEGIEGPMYEQNHRIVLDGRVRHRARLRVFQFLIDHDPTFSLGGTMTAADYANSDLAD